jgi:hypothetical protein
MRILAAPIVFALLLLAGGCGLISGDPQIDEGIVIAPKLKIRSSTDRKSVV